MSNYKTEQQELEKAIRGANDLVCAINTVGDAMNTGGSDAEGYVGAINSLAQVAKTHILDLKAMHLRMSQYDKEQEAEGSNNALLNQILNDYTDTAAELSGYVEILNNLTTSICQFDGSEPQADRNSAQDSLFTLHQSMTRFKDAQDVQMDGYAKRRRDSDVRAKATGESEREEATPAINVEKCKSCTYDAKWGCSPLKRFQCEGGYSDEWFIHLLILELRRKNNKLEETLAAERKKPTRTASAHNVKMCSQKHPAAITDRDDMFAAIGSIRDIACHFIGCESEANSTISALWFIRQTADVLCSRVYEIE